MGILGKLFQRKCQHNWVLKLPTYNVGDVFENFEGAVEEYCTKCGATRPVQECEHDWQPAIDDGKGPFDGCIKLVRTHKCSKCGVGLYEKPE